VIGKGVLDYGHFGSICLSRTRFLGWISGLFALDFPFVCIHSTCRNMYDLVLYYHG
jgi:hypothetical protein